MLRQTSTVNLQDFNKNLNKTKTGQYAPLTILYKENFMKILILVLVLGLVSCGDSTKTTTPTTPTMTESQKRSNFVSMIQSRWGANLFIQKGNGNYMIMGKYVGDPDSLIFSYSNFNGTESWLEYANESGYWSLYATGSYYNNGSWYYLGANGNYYSEKSDTTKDLESAGAKVEAMEVAELEDILVNYGLSTERASKLGKLMNSYSKIKTKRALTSREKDVFTKELTGLSFDKASSVLVDEGYDALVEKASEVNGADPEAIKELLNEVM